MFQPGKWLFDLFRFGGFALIVGGVLVMLNAVQDGAAIGGDGFALIAVGAICLVVSQRMKERRNDLDR